MKELVSSEPYDITAFQVDSGYLLLEWPQTMDSQINAHIIQIANHLRSLSNDEIIDIVPAYCSLGIFYHEELITHDLLAIIKNYTFSDHTDRAKTVHVPVCYDLSFGLDLTHLGELHQMSAQEIIEAHSNATYKVSFIGFLPGFLYLQGLSDELASPRKASPRLKIPAGSVAIGGSQTGIYPSESPGGWNIIGRCPLNLFDIDSEQPSPFQAGDQIIFNPISIEQYWTIKNEGE